MKRIFLSLSILMILSFSVSAQGLKGLIKNATKKDSTGKTSIDKMLGVSGGKSSLSTEEIVGGLRSLASRNKQRRRKTFCC